VPVGDAQSGFWSVVLKIVEGIYTVNTVEKIYILIIFHAIVDGGLYHKLIVLARTDIIAVLLCKLGTVFCRHTDKIKHTALSFL
jgi:hypothetical protein